MLNSMELSQKLALLRKGLIHYSSPPPFFYQTLG